MQTCLPLVVEANKVLNELPLWTSPDSNVNRLLQAAQNVDPGFKIMLMPDMASVGGRDVQALAANVAELAAYRSAFRLADGRLVVSPFLAERRPVSWWTEFMALMKSRHGIRVALLTTVAGLLVAIVLQVFYSYAVSKIDRIVAEMEEASVELIDALALRRMARTDGAEAAEGRRAAPPSPAPGPARVEDREQPGRP